MTQISRQILTRRSFFASSAATALTLGTAANARVAARLSDENFTYEVNRTDEEWRAMLAGDEYAILREGYTEQPKSSDLWDETRDGSYHCKGCELLVFSANWKRALDKGWVFFHHAEPNSVMLDIDGPVAEYGQMADSDETVTEVHCRRCGSHLGHLLIVVGAMTHCINGAAMTFNPASA